MPADPSAIEASGDDFGSGLHGLCRRGLPPDAADRPRLGSRIVADGRRRLRRRNRSRVHNVRNSNYRTDTDFDLRFEDRTYDLAKLDSVDYILVPLAGMPRMAHTFISFGFHGQDYLAISIEVRRLRGQPFNPLYNFLNENEIIYIAGDERDLIRLRSNFRKDDVYVYRAKLTPEQCQGLFVDMLQRANKLSRQAGVLQHADEQLRNQPHRPSESRPAAKDSVQL